MLSPGNPYVLPSVLVGAGAYLALTILTDASVLVRIAVLAFVAGVVPIALNRVLGGAADDPAPESEPAPPDEPIDDAPSESAEKSTD